MENNRKHQGNKSGIQFTHVLTEGIESFCARSARFIILFPATITQTVKGVMMLNGRWLSTSRAARDNNYVVEWVDKLTVTANL